MLVVDASVALKWLVEEDGTDAAFELRSEELAAPSLIRIEAANVLRTLVRRKAIEQAVAQSLFGLLQSAPVTIYEPDDELEARALAIALELDHPVYDCVYLALAEKTSATLVSADKKFIQTLAGTRFQPLAMPLN